jgi:hypothetical protein
METTPETVARLDAKVARLMEPQKVREPDASTGKHTNHVQR